MCIADVTDARRIRELFLSERPDVVFHAAAYKHVPLVEANAARPTIKVLYMSGYVDYSIGSSSVLDSTCEFIAKPFTSDQLLDEVRAVLEP